MRRDVLAAVARAEAFLAGLQEPDGLWRDYQLVPGPSEAWSTAVAGCALAQPPTGLSHLPALERALAAIRELRTAGGWGYNRYTAADADSTSWCVRFIAALRPGARAAPWRAVAAFLDGEGRAHTFTEAATGTWAAAHADVTAVAGLALLASGAPPTLVRRVRDAVLGAREGTRWPSFWWTTDLYATARSLELLAASGGVPADVAAARGALELCDIALTASPFELAQALSIALVLRSGRDAALLAELLLAEQGGDGGWRASAMLALPAHDGEGPPPVFPDGERILTTAMALAALKRLAGVL